MIARSPAARLSVRPDSRATLLIILLVIFSRSLLAQEQVAAPTKVYLEHADVQKFDRELRDDRQVLVGNVRFRHDSAFMYCDSAYFYEATSSLEAFGFVRMEQGDTLFVYGHYLFYDGNTQLSRLRENVRMENIQSDSSLVTLFTDSLNYDRRLNICYYFDGGMIVDERNELTSRYGEYSPSTKLAIFNDSVCLLNENMTLYSDTLHYNTDTQTADILGPSVIIADSGTIHTSRGWYNTAENTSLLLDRSLINSGNRLLTGDSISYSKELGIGEAFGNVYMQDTMRCLILEGQYGYYVDSIEYAFTTDRARCLEYSRGDTLYIHADTFELIKTDSVSRELKAYHGVRFYRVDLQGVCDSLHYYTKDSLLSMYRDPILWNEDNQITGDTIFIHVTDSVIDRVDVFDHAFSIQQLDSVAYNQLKGKSLTAYLRNNTIHTIYIDGSAETIFYPLEEDGTMLGMNETKSSYLRISIRENKLDRLVAWPSPEGKMTPIPDLHPDQQRLKDFVWYDYIRPRDRDDIFRVVGRRAGDSRPSGSGRFKFR